MRRQFYGDRKDVFKWSLALRVARPNKRILYIAMLREDKPVNHGRDMRSVPGAESSVVRYFEGERRIPEPERYDISRIKRLSPSIELVLDPYSYSGRLTYFHRALARLETREPGEEFVILLDPDNGIAGKSPRSEHVCGKELESTWSKMLPGDVLLVYQHQFRDNQWVSKRRSVLADAVGLPLDRVQCERMPELTDVCFYVAFRHA